MSLSAEQLQRWTRRYPQPPRAHQGWSNWSGLSTANPHSRTVVSDEDSVLDMISRARREGRTLKAVGASHSFTPVAATDGFQLSLDDYSGLVAFDPDTLQATIRGGTRLRDLPALLAPWDAAVPNQGDIDPQSLVGAISTSTHGTGVGFTGFAGLVRHFRLATADGRILDCSPTENAEIFELTRVGLGAFGIVTDVTLQTVPQFILAAEEHPEPLDQVVQNFAARSRQADHMEFYWFPYTDVALVKENTRHDVSALRTEHNPIPRYKKFFADEVVNNALLYATCRATTAIPALTKRVNQLAAGSVPSRSYCDYSHEVFVTPRRVRFNEMEYAIPLADFTPVFEELRRVIESSDMPIEFPLEVRTAAADDVPLSTAVGRDTAYIALHRFVGPDFREFFALCEPILREAQGRPHWGKLHTLGYEELSQVYPDLSRCAQLRETLDPEGMFANPMVNTIFGRDAQGVDRN